MFELTTNFLRYILTLGDLVFTIYLLTARFGMFIYHIPSTFYTLGMMNIYTLALREFCDLASNTIE